MRKIYIICFLIMILNLGSCKSNKLLENTAKIKTIVTTIQPTNTPINSPTDNKMPTYDLIGDNNSISNVKYSIKIKINKKLIENDMKKILDKIVMENPNYERYFIEHYLGEDIQNNYYATSHYEVDGSKYSFNIKETLPTNTPKKEEFGEKTDVEIVKDDIKNVEDTSTIIVSKDKNKLIISITEKENHPFIEANETAIANYTDWITENIKSDIREIDISVIRPNSNVRALLNMSELKNENGGYFDEQYIRESLTPY